MLEAVFIKYTGLGVSKHIFYTPSNTKSLIKFKIVPVYQVKEDDTHSREKY